MPEITCAVVRDLLEAYLDGETSEETRSILKEHVASCPACQEMVATRQSLLGELRQLGAATPTGASPAGASPTATSAATSPDQALIRRAHRRLLASVWRRLAAAALGVSLLAGLGWYFITPVGSGLYLPRIGLAQLVVTPESSEPGSRLPFLWVPSYPGEAPPEPGRLAVWFDDGSVGHWYAFDAHLKGGFAGFPRYREGSLGLARGSAPPLWSRVGNGVGVEGQPPAPPIWPVEGSPYVQREAASITLTRPGGWILASGSGRNLYVVQVNEPLWSEGTSYLACGMGAGLSGPFFVLRNISAGTAVELVEVVLPPTTDVQVALNDATRSVPLALPLTLAPGESAHIFAAASQGPGSHPARDPRCYVITPLLVVRVDGQLHYWVPGSFFTSLSGPLHERYDLEPPE
jgi:hypothetical protein